MSAHQVRQARFRVRTGQVPDSDQRQRWQHLFQTRYLPLLERALDNWMARHPALQSQTIRVPSLKLDLGKLRGVHDDDALLHALERQLDERLQNVAAFSTSDWTLQCHLRFLREGAWPVGSAPATVQGIEQWWREHQSLVPALRAALLPHRADTTLWVRLCLQHSPGFLHWLCRQLDERATVPNSPLISPPTSPRTSPSGNDVSLLATVRLWQLLYEHDSVPFSRTTLNSLRSTLAPGTTSADVPTAALLREVLRHDRLAPTPSDSDAVTDSVSTRPTRHPAKGEQADGEPGHDDRAAGIPVQQAGLILLHPWLPELFTESGLLRNREFPDADSRLRAIFALHYAATGRDEADEGELALHKYLVGWPAAEPLPAALALDTREREAIDDLLRSTIAHWQALKNTSIDGLRDPFLAREGVLRHEDGLDKLIVASGPFDMLLGTLPWSISVVRWPWLPAPLHVHWTQA